jgi:uncharacterized SAM-binding protein YcdF (DUF218 family)
MIESSERHRPARIFHWRHVKSGLFAAAALALILMFLRAPSYLLGYDNPIQADVAAVMLGPGFAERIRQGQKLLAEGRVSYLIIPGRCVVFANGPGGKLDAQMDMLGLGHPLCIDLDEPKYRVKTHRELERTRAIMEGLGFRSVNLVSSPYHMRRINIIAQKVFDSRGFRYSTVSAERNGEGSWKWWQSREDWWWVSREYAKLAWFTVYSAFE